MNQKRNYRILVNPLVPVRTHPSNKYHLDKQTERLNAGKAEPRASLTGGAFNLNNLLSCFNF